MVSCSNLRLALFAGFTFVIFMVSQPPFYHTRKNYVYHSSGRTRPLFMSKSGASAMTSSQVEESTASGSSSDTSMVPNVEQGLDTPQQQQPTTEDDGSSPEQQHTYHRGGIKPNAYKSTVTTIKYSQPETSFRHEAQEPQPEDEVDETNIVEAMDEAFNAQDQQQQEQARQEEQPNENLWPLINLPPQQPERPELFMNQLPPEDSDTTMASFSCKPRLPSQAQPRTPILVFSSGGPSSGSNLFFDFLLHQVSLPPASSSANNNHPYVRKHLEHVKLFNFPHLFAPALVGEASGSDFHDNEPRSTPSPTAAVALGSYMWDTAMAMGQNCLDTDLNQLTELLQSQWLSKRVVGSSTTSVSQQSATSTPPHMETIHFLQQEGERRPNLGHMVSLYENRRRQMVQTIQFLNQLPCLGGPNTKPAVALHLSDDTLDSAKVDPDALVASLYQKFWERQEYELENGEGMVQYAMTQTKPIHFVVLWRRRMIETFVQLELARERSKEIRSSTTNEVQMASLWNQTSSTGQSSPQNKPHVRRRARIYYASKEKKGSTTSSPSSFLLEIDYERLDRFMGRTKRYYKSLRNQFQTLGVEYHVFEYDRDFSTNEGMLRSVERVQHLLNLTTSTSDSNKHAKEIVTAWSKKQRQSQSRRPLNQIVSNWDQVVQWGYGSEKVNEWEDLFAPSV